MRGRTLCLWFPFPYIFPNSNLRPLYSQLPLRSHFHPRYSRTNTEYHYFYPSSTSFLHLYSHFFPLTSRTNHYHTHPYSHVPLVPLSTFSTLKCGNIIIAQRKPLVTFHLAYMFKSWTAEYLILKSQMRLWMEVRGHSFLYSLIFNSILFIFKNNYYSLITW